MVLVLVLALVLDWLPWLKNVDDATRFLGILWSLVALALLGVVWLSIFLLSVRYRNLRRKWLLVAPLVLLLGGAIIVGVSKFAPSDFDSSRKELDSLAAEVSRKPAGWRQTYSFEDPRTIGRIEVLSVEHRDDGVVLVDDADGSALFKVRGWAYSISGPPDFGDGVEVQHVDGNWYSYTYQ